MAQLALDDVDRDTFARELDRVGVPQLMRREPATDARLSGELAQLTASGGRGPTPAGSESHRNGSCPEHNTSRPARSPPGTAFGSRDREPRLAS